MSDDDLIRRGDALAAIQLGDTVMRLQARIRAIPPVDADPICTDCGGTGITYQTERRCACQPPLAPAPDAHVAGLREAIAEGMRIATVVPVEQVPDAINAFLARAAEGGSHE